ncbi:uncharacterized protein LOC110736511 [Chenopodium quinoa]|uniref:DUF3615 domain-containing protein n=1 Tax=Chenopodium quinoa TaxID=63459 RepID=A0A803KN05_CHEQI|nr:uncharacterized protein LOC110736511 [Chenopodium quinoa]
MDDSIPVRLFRSIPPLTEFRDADPWDSTNLDKVTDDFLAKCDKWEKDSYPIFIPDTDIFFPGRMDCSKPISKAELHSQLAEYSEKALAYFNKTNNTDYKAENNGEIVHGDQDHCYATHCNFTAKPDRAPLIPGDFSSKLFFAEFMNTLQAKSSLTYWSLLDGADYKKYCNMCPVGVIRHPKTFQYGDKPPLD